MPPINTWQGHQYYSIIKKLYKIALGHDSPTAIISWLKDADDISRIYYTNYEIYFVKTVIV